MFVQVSCLVMALASASAATSRSSLPLNLKASLNDHSWNLGQSSLLGVGDGANSTCNAVFSCADCNTAQICRPTAGGNFVPVTKVACPADRPYCDYGTGSCTTVPDGSCGQTDDFICLRAQGHFPGKSCSIYHVCDNYVAHKFECKIEGQSYNADLEACDSNSKCASFQCDGSGKKVASDLYPRYFTYCIPGTPGQPGVIDKCDGINQLNATSQLCEPICSEEGVLPDMEDCTKYYKCSYLWINESTKYLMRERHECPENTGFDPSNFICVSLDGYPTCKANSPTAAPTAAPPTTHRPTTKKP